MKKNILIWGCGLRGDDAYRILDMSRKYNITAFGDNNSHLWGTKKEGKTIIGPHQLETLTDLDCILIASSYAPEIKEQLTHLTTIPLYDNVEDLVYTNIIIDISGFCNARCKWCVTGNKNRKEGIPKPKYMSYELFIKVYEHLYQNQIIEKFTEITLYNWGEPFLNPDYLKIIEYLSQKEHPFSVSTNASVLQYANNPNAYKYCTSFIFSMPGFSQSSYDKIHGFNFTKIKQNIINLNNNINSCGFVGNGIIAYHVYHFNLHEISMANEFANSLNYTFNPYYAYFNGNSMMETYLKGNMEDTMLKEAQSEIFLAHVPDFISKASSDTHCFFEHQLAIDCDGNLVLCCAADSACNNYTWGNICEINSFEILKEKRQLMLKCDTCNKCRKLGISHWIIGNRYIKNF